MPTLEQPAARDWDFPRAASGTGLLVDHAVEHGMTATAALRGTGLVEADLADPGREVTAAQELRVVRNLLAGLPPEHGRAAGVRVGARYHASTFGIFGYALMSSPTVLDAVNVALRFIDLSHTFTIPVPTLEGDQVVVELRDDGIPADVRRFVVERDLAAMHTVLDDLLPGGVPFTSARLALEGPADGDGSSYDEVLGLVPAFGAEGHGFSFAAAYLERPLPQGNPRTVAVCEAMCRDVVSARRARSGLTQHVRVLVTQRVAHGATLPAVASDLGLSERTLRRRLAEEGTSFQALLDEVRDSLAGEMLATGRMPVEDVALRLGYAEASSFIHAFKRWRGTTPTRFQRDAAGPAPLR